ncbi:MAG: hypothetical protein KC944_14460 [Candidatus Omnitrophica bacterium]|nr:hypothetical protein [Candidatus Omnitrophota bacterium]
MRRLIEHPTKSVRPFRLCIATILPLLFCPPHAHSESAYKFQLVGELCRSKQVLAGLVSVDPSDGRERLWLTNDNEEKGCEILSIDFEKDTGEMFVAPAGAGAWGFLEIPGKRFVVSTFYDGTFMTFDIAKKTFLNHKRLGDQTYVWSVAMGSDGRVYGGSYPGARLGAFDPDTGEVEDLGCPLEPNMYLRMTASTPGRQILCSLGNNTPGHQVYDPQKKTFQPLPGLDRTATVSSPTVFENLFIASVSGKGVMAWKGDELEPVSSERLPKLPDGATWYPVSGLCTPDRLIMQSGTKIYRLDRGEATPTFLFEKDLRGGILRGISRDGIVLGNRGQDYFLLRPPDYDLEIRPIPIEARGRSPLFLRSDPEGRIWGGPHFGQTLFYYDPDTDETVNTGAICDGGGEVYDVAFQNGKTYAVSYAGGDITVFDPGLPWDQWNLENPKPLANVRDEGFIRPLAGIDVGKDGFLYSGWMAKYGVYGGSLARTDPETGEQEVYENPLGPRALSALDTLDGRVYLGTTLSANGLGNATGPVTVGAWDIVEKKIVASRDFEGPSNVSHLAAFPKGIVVALDGATLLVLDPETLETRATLPLDGDGISSFRFQPDIEKSEVWFARGKKIGKFSVPQGEWTTLATFDKPIQNLTRDSDGRVFVSAGAEILQLRFN